VVGKRYRAFLGRSSVRILERTSRDFYARLVAKTNVRGGPFVEIKRDLAVFFLADSVASQIAIGLLVGIIAFACGHFWRDTLAPILRNLTYSGIQISGTWTSNLPDSFFDHSAKADESKTPLGSTRKVIGLKGR
jgi:hypothetical protein